MLFRYFLLPLSAASFVGNVLVSSRPTFEVGVHFIFIATLIANCYIRLRSDKVTYIILQHCCRAELTTDS